MADNFVHTYKRDKREQGARLDSYEHGFVPDMGKDYSALDTKNDV